MICSTSAPKSTTGGFLVSTISKMMTSKQTLQPTQSKVKTKLERWVTSCRVQIPTSTILLTRLVRERNPTPSAILEGIDQIVHSRGLTHRIMILAIKKIHLMRKKSQSLLWSRVTKASHPLVLPQSKRQLVVKHPSTGLVVLMNLLRSLMHPKGSQMSKIIRTCLLKLCKYSSYKLFNRLIIKPCFKIFNLV